jgi:hypothetical protein
MKRRSLGPKLVWILVLSMFALFCYGCSPQQVSTGGDLSVESGADRTLCTIQSTAPILDPSSDASMQFIETVPSLLCGEVEALLAQRQARWGGNPLAFENRLGEIDPMQLYAACIKALAERLEQHLFVRTEWSGAFIRFLHMETDHLAEEGIRLSDISPLDDLL